MFRRAAFDAIGGFDERIFLSGEDDDICLRLSAAGWSLVHVADAEAFHIGGAVLGADAAVSLGGSIGTGNGRELYLSQQAWRCRESGAVSVADCGLGEERRLRAAGATREKPGDTGRRRALALAFARGREAQKVGIELRPVSGPLAAGSSSEAR